MLEGDGIEAAGLTAFWWMKDGVDLKGLQEAERLRMAEEGRMITGGRTYEGLRKQRFCMTCELIVMLVLCKLCIKNRRVWSLTLISPTVDFGHGRSALKLASTETGSLG